MMEKERGKKKTKRSELGTLKPTPRHEALIHNLCLPSSYAEQYESKGISFMNPFFAQIYFPHELKKIPFISFIGKVSLMSYGEVSWAFQPEVIQG